MIGAQASRDQFEKILNYIQIGKDEGAEVLCGGGAHKNLSGLEEGFYVEPTLIKGHNKMRVFQEEIFGPVASGSTAITIIRHTPRSAATKNRALDAKITK
jgi:aldehyde dehydrogenase